MTDTFTSEELALKASDCTAMLSNNFKTTMEEYIRKLDISLAKIYFDDNFDFYYERAVQTILRPQWR